MMKPNTHILFSFGYNNKFKITRNCFKKVIYNIVKRFHLGYYIRNNPGTDSETSTDLGSLNTVGVRTTGHFDIDGFLGLWSAIFRFFFIAVLSY